MTISYGSLFSGIGGGDLGLERAGMAPRWLVEIEPTCQRILRRHWPGLPVHDDVRAVGAHNLEPVDVIIFGSPCQDLSVAGKRAGMAGERSGLFFEAVRVIRELRPRLAIWENVPGAFSSNRGADFGAVLDTLADAGALGLGWRVLDAQWFGVPQRRRRIFLVADFGDGRLAEVLAEPEGLSGDPAAGGEAGADVAGPLGSGAPGRGWPSDLERMTFVPVGPLTATGLGKAGPDVKQAQAGHLIAFTSKEDGRDALADTSPTLRAMNFDKSRINGGGQVAVAFGGNNTSGPIEVATCLNAHGGTGRLDFESETFLVEPAVYQCHGTNVGPLGALRQGDGGVTSGVPFAFYPHSGLEQTVREDLSPPLTVAGHCVGTVAVLARTVALRGRDGGATAELGDEVATALRASQGGGDKPHVLVEAIAENQRGELRTSAIHPQLTAGGGKPGQGYPAIAFTERGREGGRNLEHQEELAYALTNPGAGGRSQERNLAAAGTVRRLTPRECERLQAFPDDWTLLGDDGRQISDSARYRALGNAMCVSVVEWVGRRVVAAWEGN